MDRQTLLACRDALRHRGPDGAGLWSSADGRVMFGHRRLAIVDLSDAGAQPMSLTNGNWHITFNGEIYNHDELRRELRALGHSFRGHSDTEVLLAALAQWDTRCLSRLRGMFAFAAYDRQQERVLLARDRAGEKPLFWTHVNSGLLFASELKGLLANPALARRLDLPGLDSYLALGYVPAHQCLVKGVHKLPPAHYLEYSLRSGTTTTHAYWTLPDDSPQPAIHESDLLDELDRLLQEAVKEQLQADVPVSVLLSGGMDSSLVTACAARVSDRPVRTFSVGFPGQGEFDERKHARRIASYFGTEHMELDLEASSVALIPELARHYCEPIADSSMIPTFLLCRLVVQHGKAVLGGDGGDELFGGYKSYQGAVRLEALRRFVPRPLRMALSSVASASLPVGFRGRNALVQFGGSMSDGVAAMGVLFDRALRRRLVPALESCQDGPTVEHWKRSLVEPARGVPGTYMAADFRSYLPGDILVKVDRASMANSLEVRAPFLDARLIEFAFGKVPNQLRTTSSQRKILPRRLAARLLPPDFDADRKQGFSIPLTDWLTPKVRSDACDRFESKFPDLFDFATVRSLLGASHVGGVNRVYGLLMLMYWMEAYDVSL